MVVNQAAPEGDSIVSPTPVDGYTGVVIGGGGAEPEWLLRGMGPIIAPHLIGWPWRYSWHDHLKRIGYDRCGWNEWNTRGLGHFRQFHNSRYTVDRHSLCLQRKAISTHQ